MSMQFPDRRAPLGRPVLPLRIAFYAPMKSPDHPVPSGDRLMARQLVAALGLCGHAVTVVSHLRSYSPNPDATAYEAIKGQALREADRLRASWSQTRRPDLWFTYHPYYKAPDLLGPGLTAELGIPYVTAETSWSARRNIGVWAQMQDRVLDGLGRAAVNICLTGRDRIGILEAAPGARTAMLPPFIDAGSFIDAQPMQHSDGMRMITVAMMRPGDKMDSYRLLAEALDRLSPDLPWHLSVVGDGPMRAETMALFAGISDRRITWHGQATPQQIAGLMAASALYIWPGYGEAYGLAFLEAQAAGLPVVAQRAAGVPEAVQDGTTALLTPPGDAAALAHSMQRLLTDATVRATMSAAARRFVRTDRTIERASDRLGQVLQAAVGAEG